MTPCVVVVFVSDESGTDKLDSKPLDSPSSGFETFKGESVKHIPISLWWKSLSVQLYRLLDKPVDLVCKSKVAGFSK